MGNIDSIEEFVENIDNNVTITQHNITNISEDIKSIEDNIESIGGNISSIEDNIEYQKNISNTLLRIKEFGGHTYRFYHFMHLKWDNAEAFCVETGGHLASIHSEAEHNFLVDELIESVDDFIEGLNSELNKFMTSYLGNWIGGQRHNETAWTWSDGTPWDYENWDTDYGQP